MASVWLQDVPTRSHGSPIIWNSSPNAARINTLLGVAFEEPSALNLSDAHMFLAQPFRSPIRNLD